MKIHEIEDKIIDSLLDEMIGQGFVVSVFDGEEYVTQKSTNKAAIMSLLRSTEDGDTLRFTKGEGASRRASWAQLIYGNDGHDVIADSSSALDVYIPKTSALIDELCEKAQ